MWAIFAAAGTLFTATCLAADDERPIIGFQSETWTMNGGRVVEHLGREALAGSAFLKDVEFTDGVIEVDIAMDGRRCFPGVVFRAESEADTEVFYVRPHRSKNYSHALQYTPRFRGLTGWQLYSGPGFTATADIPLERWVPLKIEVLGTRARIYFDDMENPALVVADLKRGKATGYIGITAPPDGRVHYSNFRYSTDVELDFGPQPIRPVSRGNLDAWEISQPIAPPNINRDLAPSNQDLGEITWQRVTADATGLVDIARHLESQPRLPGCVIARTTIASSEPERRKLHFGYSDEISVFVNGDLLFRGDSTFRVRDTEFMGIIGLNDAVVMDLAEGNNELIFVVTESFGGWGFMARAEGLRADPFLLADGIAKVWELEEGLMMPESAAWDPQREHFYVSNMNPAGPAEFGETGYVSRIDATGHVLDNQWVTGLRGPTGVAVLGDRLYAVERTGVAVIDLDTGEIVDRRLIETQGGFLNDLAVADDESLFVSDSALGVIYRWRPDGAELWFEDEAIAGANGLLVQKDRLIATTMGSESLVAINLKTRDIEAIVDLRPFGGDGITADGSGAYLVSDYSGLLLRVDLQGAREVLIDSRDTGISLTDFAFAPERSLAVIPTLRGNTLMAFTLE
jgi:sugar lactone lactonase YvrE